MEGSTITPSEPAFAPALNNRHDYLDHTPDIQLSKSHTRHNNNHNV
jgi:hypothetical protein